MYYVHTENTLLLLVGSRVKSDGRAMAETRFGARDLWSRHAWCHDWSIVVS